MYVNFLSKTIGGQAVIFPSKSFSLTDSGVIDWQHPDVGNVDLPSVSVVEEHPDAAIVLVQVVALDRGGEQAVVGLAPVHADASAGREVGTGTRADFADLRGEGRRFDLRPSTKSYVTL